MTLNREDLEKLFDNDQDTRLEIGGTQPIKVTKPKQKVDELKKVRKKIHRSKERKPKRKNLDISLHILRFTFFAGIFSFILLIIINLPAISDRVSWTYNVEYLNRRMPEKTVSPTPDPNSSVSLPSSLPNVESNNLSPGIHISKIGVNAPIIWDVDQDNIVDELINGVVHYKGTSLPGKGGNVFLVGHSSNYFWINSEYNSIFSLLDKLSKGDRISIVMDNKKYYYEVIDQKIVNPDEVEVLRNTPKETLSLMTCWPVGTSLNRLVIIAELKYSSN